MVLGPVIGNILTAAEKSLATIFLFYKFAVVVA